MKLRDIILDANANLLRSKTRTFLTIIAIFIGALTLTITNGIGAGVSNYIDQQLGNIGAENVLSVQPRNQSSTDGGPQQFDPDTATGTSFGFGPSIPLLNEKDLAVIRDIKGVQNAEFLLTPSPNYAYGDSGQKYQLSVSAHIDGMNLVLSEGSAPKNDSREYEIALPIDYPKALGYSSAKDAVGKQVTIGVTTATGEQREVKAKISGVQDQTLVSIGGAVINSPLAEQLDTIQKEGSPSSVDKGYLAVVARVAENSSQEDIEQVKTRLSKAGFESQTVQDQIGLFKQVIGAIVTVLNAFAVIALIAASFGIVNTLLMSVQERTKEIGLMKAMGLGSGKVFLLFSFEAILLGFWGSLLGSLAGIGIGSLVNKIAAETFLKDLPGFSLTAFSIPSVLIIMAIIMLIAFLAGTMPARKASKKNPIDALRYE